VGKKPGIPLAGWVRIEHGHVDLGKDQGGNHYRMKSPSGDPYSRIPVWVGWGYTMRRYGTTIRKGVSKLGRCSSGISMRQLLCVGKKVTESGH